MTARVLVVDDVPANLKLLKARLCRRIDSEPFAIQQGARNLDVTISIGIAALACACDTAAAIARRYRALSRQARRLQSRCVGCGLEKFQRNFKALKNHFGWYGRLI